MAESPPESREEQPRFFYNPKQESWDYLYRAVMQVVFPDFSYRVREKGRWLDKFCDHGYYLIDATDSPINRCPTGERKRILEGAVGHKLSELRELISSKTPIVLIKRNVFEVFSGPLVQNGYNLIHKSFLPFPAYGHQKAFVDACRNCTKSWIF